jgi:4-alpha-glucanotransferase
MPVERSSGRKSGILCHPTSMPGAHGIGDLGEGPRRYVDFLVDAGQTLWQVLPLGPTGYGDSPYQPFSAFAGNPLLVDLTELVQEGLLDRADLCEAEALPADRVDYGRVIDLKARALRATYANLMHDAHPLRQELDVYIAEQAHWLDDYALFMALKERFAWKPWVEWEPDIALRRDDAVARWRMELADTLGFHRFAQFLFARQWARVRAYANAASVAIIGDMPIFVGHDSADVWSHRDLFRLDGRGYPTVVAGVPPDYFSATGQLWGNPLYRWDVMRERDYAWWLARLRNALSQVDMVRLDHFRGFAGYWEVPADEETAINGRWVRGPGAHFFEVVRRALGTLPIIAEDLGLISVDVHALRRALSLRGMRVLQFGFGGDASNLNLPHNWERNLVAYTGTHDNDTSLGWYRAADERARHQARIYTGTDGSDIHWTLIRLTMNSVADMAIFPLQDVLGLGSEARMNRPGQPHGNWTWRYAPDALRPELAAVLRTMAEASGRWLPPGKTWDTDTPLTLMYQEP